MTPRHFAGRGGFVGRVTTVAAVAVAISGAACRRDDADGSARLVTRAFDELERASNSDRRDALAALRSAPCAKPETCAEKEACVAYATSMVRAKELMERAAALGPVDGGGNGAATPEERTIIIAAADDALRDAERVHPECERALRRLRERGRR